MKDAELTTLHVDFEKVVDHSDELVSVLWSCCRCMGQIAQFPRFIFSSLEMRCGRRVALSLAGLMHTADCSTRWERPRRDDAGGVWVGRIPQAGAIVREFYR